jgi:hypothetical protein
MNKSRKDAARMMRVDDKVDVTTSTGVVRGSIIKIKGPWITVRTNIGDLKKSYVNVRPTEQYSTDLVISRTEGMSSDEALDVIEALYHHQYINRSTCVSACYRRMTCDPYQY